MRKLKLRNVLLIPIIAFLLFSIIVTFGCNGKDPTAPGSPYSGLIVGKWKWDAQYDSVQWFYTQDDTVQVISTFEANGGFFDEWRVPNRSFVVTRGTYRIEDRTDGSYLITEGTIVAPGASNTGEKSGCTYKIILLNETEMQIAPDYDITKRVRARRIQ